LRIEKKYIKEMEAEWVDVISVSEKLGYMFARPCDNYKNVRKLIGAQYLKVRKHCEHSNNCRCKNREYLIN